MIEATPASFLPTPVARQEQIIAVINAALACNPMQGFCFIGSPGTGKTFLMKAIQHAIRRHITSKLTTVMSSRICTLAEWQENNRRKATDKPTDSHLDEISTERINKVAADNVLYSTGVDSSVPLLFWSLHYFIDEFDSQPTMSAFSASHLQSFINACYENAPRFRPGNSQECVQLVIAMNKSWPEFEDAYGRHIARRIAEMCVRIDFDKEEVIDFRSMQREQELAKQEEEIAKYQDDIDDLIGKHLLGE